MASSSPDTDWKQLEVDVRQTCLGRSVLRVNKYRVELEKRIRRLSEEDSQREGEALLTDLASRFCNIPDNEKLCQQAWDFLKSDVEDRLEAYCKTCADPSNWGEVRHYIGRLRAWHRAAELVTRIAAKPKASKLLQKLRVRHVSLSRTARRPQQLVQDHDADLDRILRTIFPELPSGLAKMRLKSVIGPRKGSQEPRDLNELLESIAARQYAKDVHVEVALADYVHDQGLLFLDKSRYIGCSKPSCYGCSLYLQSHPLDLGRRPSHNRVWLRWCYPACSESASDETRSQWDARFARFCDLVRMEAQRTLLWGKPARHYLRDSVTDQAASTRMMDGLMLSELGSLG